MAGDWIKVEHVTPDKPEVYRMATILNVTPEDVMGRLVRVWAWADQQSLDGNAVGVTEVTLDAVSRRNGFGVAMREVGWLGSDGHTLSFPNFDRHNGNTSKERALTNKRVKRHRNAEGVSKPLPEKRREEKKTTPTPSGFARFWLAWPTNHRKAAKADCLKRWGHHDLEAHADRIVAHVETMKRSTQWTKDRGEFIPAPLTYLNQSRWDQDAPAPRDEFAGAI